MLGQPDAEPCIFVAYTGVPHPHTMTRRAGFSPAKAPLWRGISFQRGR